MFDTECRWEIETDMRYKLQISFEDLDLPMNVSRVARYIPVVGTPNINAKHFPNGKKKKIYNLFLFRLDLVKKSLKKKKKPWRSWNSDSVSRTSCSSTALITVAEPSPPEVESLVMNIFQQFNERTKRDLILGYVCDNLPVVPIRASANKIVIEFQSGPSPPNHLNVPVRGFKLNFTSVGKGRIFLFNFWYFLLFLFY